jgi:hypothetical protein
LVVVTAALVTSAFGANSLGMNCLVRNAQMRALIGALMLAALVVGSAPALACDDDEIEFIAIDGSLIRMRSGATFHVISSDQLDASLWLAMDDVLICKDETEIINKNHEGERVTAKRLRR